LPLLEHVSELRTRLVNTLAAVWGLQGLKAGGRARTELTALVRLPLRGAGSAGSAVRPTRSSAPAASARAAEFSACRLFVAGLFERRS
jgi:hypothetical protein